MMGMGLEQEIKDQALALGSDAVGITDTAPIGAEHVEHFERWLRAGCAGRMEYMHRNLGKRINPAQLRKGAKSVIVVALNYRPPRPIADCELRIADSTSHDNFQTHTPTAELMDTVQGSGPHSADSPIRNPKSAIRNPPAEPVGRVATYAQYEDYHPFIKALLRELAGFICMRTRQQDRFKICVDSAPVAEKALAVRAGLGFIGKNHLLIHPQLGPQILLGELLTSVPLQPDQPIEGACLGCNRCVEACPTGALRPDGLLDATRCTSYLTQYGSQQEWNAGMLECWNNGEKTAQHSNPLGDWLFGCDGCLCVCPFHEKAPACANRRFRFYPDRAKVSLQDVLKITPETFEARFHDSPLRRLGLEGIKHNARKCLESQIADSDGT
jgi:epoxyqueuosine reductase